MRYGFWIMAALVVVLDQWAKVLVQALIPLNSHPQPVIPGFLSFTHVHNTGVAFGQFQNGGVLLILAALVAVIAIVQYRRKLLREHGPLHPLLMFGLALPLGGAIGNMIDRIRIGRVVDFLDVSPARIFGNFPVFNVADSAITVGAVLLVVYFLFLSPPEREVQVAEPGQASPSAAVPERD